MNYRNINLFSFPDNNYSFVISKEKIMKNNYKFIEDIIITYNVGNIKILFWMNVGNKHSHGRHYLLILKLSFKSIIETSFIFNSKIYLYTSKIFEC